MKQSWDKEHIGYNFYFQEDIYGVYLIKKFDKIIKSFETFLGRCNTHPLKGIFYMHLMLVVSETIWYSFIINLKKPVGYS